MQDFRKLEVWQLSHRLTLDAFRIFDRRISRFPNLRSQALRAAQSIGSNISEGSGASGREFARCLELSLKSAKELENDLLLARDLPLITPAEFNQLERQLEVVRRKLIALIRAVRGC